MDTCKVCKRPIHEEPDWKYCSDFCSELTDADKVKWLTMQPGDWGYYPCAECGCIIEDEYTGPGAMCSNCYKRVRTKKAVTLLEESVQVMSEAEDALGRTGTLLPMIAKIREFLQER